MATLMRIFTVATAAVLASALCGPALSAERLALVVGNGGYDPANIPRLDNPVNDARLMAKALESAEFEVALVTDADRDAMYDAIDEFGARLRSAGKNTVGLFYYAGHGVEAGGANYLIPLDADIDSERGFSRHAVSAQEVLSWMEQAGNRLNLLILDACRDNPYGDKRGGVRGLGRMDAPSGSLIAYSAGPGETADDGDGANSPYTLALAEMLVEPGLKVEDVFKRVRVRVERETGDRQTPWENSSLRGDFYFVPAAAVADDRDVERVFWDSIRDSRDPAKFRAYLEKYGEDGEFAALAGIELGALKAGGGTATAEPGEAAPAIVAAVDPTPEALEFSLGLERGDRRLIQRGLASLGLEPGLADGLLGPRTRGAIRGYQEAKGFEATGYLSAEQAQTLVALGAEDARAQAKSNAERREAQRRAEAEREKAQRPEKSPGRRFRDCAACPELVVVPGGSFMMGSPSGEAGRDDDEGPVHRVTISKPLAVGVYEVTVGEFGRFVGETGHVTGDSCWIYEGGEWKSRGGRNWRNPGFSQSDAHPVVCVNWEDAQAYVRWLSRETGEDYRLLSESEWEYVARGGTETSRYWGGGASAACRYVNVADRSLKEQYSGWRWKIHECRDGHVHTAPAGSFSPNGYGLYDVLGNVWEWVGDCWNDSYGGAPRDGRAWESGDCSLRVLRGGSWSNEPRSVRSADRGQYPTGFRPILAGFRVASTLD